MENCKTLQQKIRSGPEGVKEVLEELGLDTSFQKISYANYRRFHLVKKMYDWEDIHLESILRFVDKVLEGKEIRHCDRYFFSISRNYCRELHRKIKGKPPRRQEPSRSGGDLTDDLLGQVEEYIKNMQGQCRIILLALYFFNPPYSTKFPDQFAEYLQTQGFDLSASSISAAVSRCKRQLIDALNPDKKKLKTSGSD